MDSSWVTSLAPWCRCLLRFPTARFLGVSRARPETRTSRSLSFRSSPPFATVAMTRIRLTCSPTSLLLQSLVPSPLFQLFWSLRAVQRDDESSYLPSLVIGDGRRARLGTVLFSFPLPQHRFSTQRFSFPQTTVVVACSVAKRLTNPDSAVERKHL